MGENVLGDGLEGAAVRARSGVVDVVGELGQGKSFRQRTSPGSEGGRGRPLSWCPATSEPVPAAGGEAVPGHRLVRDAALVRSARRRIDDAISALAAQPFDVAAAAGMQRALQASPGARAALQRLGAPDVSAPIRPGLRAVAGGSLSCESVPAAVRQRRSRRTGGDAA